jgi:hypothetical protein
VIRILVYSTSIVLTVSLHLGCGNTILQHLVALCGPGLLVYFSVYVQLRLLFTLLFSTATIQYMARPNWPSSSVQLCLTRQLQMPPVHFRLPLRWSHACVQIYGFVCGIFLLSWSLVVLNVFVCCIRCTVLGRRSSCLLEQTHLVSPTCTVQDGQSGRNMQCIFATERIVNDNRSFT